MTLGSKLVPDWYEWRYDGNTHYIVQRPEIGFISWEEAQDYCDEHNRALAGQAVIRERERIIDVIDAHIRFHCEVVESANKAGATMAAISGGISALSMLKRDLL